MHQPPAQPQAQAGAPNGAGPADALTAALYQDLRRLAASFLRSERVNHTLQPTALVHEAYLRLAREHEQFSDRTRFVAHASSMMRRILVDHARAKSAEKRGGAMTQIPLNEGAAAGAPGADQPGTAVDLLALDAALQRLAQIEPDQARIVELRFFGGLNVDETAKVMNIGRRSVDREWVCARAWLFRELGGREP